MAKTKIETDHGLNVAHVHHGPRARGLYAIIISVMFELGVSVVLRHRHRWWR